MTLNTPTPYCPACRRRHERNTDSSNGSSTASKCPQITQPSPEEQKDFYYGMPSCPRLIGRVSSMDKKWKTHKQQLDEYTAAGGDTGFFEYDWQRPFCIGNHTIIEKWDAIKDEILKCIAGLPWNAVDVFRLGVFKEDKPVVVWVALDHDATPTPWDTVHDALLACKETLDSVGLHDVDVQFRSAVLKDLGLLTPKTGQDYKRKIHRYIQPLSNGVGLSVFPSDVPTTSGSVGVYLRPAKGDANNEEKGKRPLWALTCHHVVLPKEDKEKKKAAVAFGAQDLVDAALQVEMEPYDGLRSVHASSEENREWAESHSLWPIIMDAIEEVQKISKPQDRHFGNVVCSPPISSVSSKKSFDNFKWTRDWALIEVDCSHTPVNVADIRAELYTTILEDFEFDRYSARDCTFVMPQDGLLPLSGIVPAEELCDGGKGHIVGKRSATTGMTFGMTSEIKSVTRSFINGQEMIAHEWAVALLAGWEHISMPTFSAKGDSGSALFTLDGRVAAFVTRGSYTSSGVNSRAKVGIVHDTSPGAVVDITYASPAGYVLADVARTLGQEVCLL